MKSMREVNLETYSLSLLTAKEDILNPRSSTNWALFAYDGIMNRLKLADSGGGLKELSAKLHPRRPLYGMCRVGTAQPCIAMILWVGNEVDEYRRAECASHLPAIRAFFKEVHIFLPAHTLDEITEERICTLAYNAAVVTKGPRGRPVRRMEDKQAIVGTNYKRTIAAAEIQRDSFWAQAEREEEERKKEEQRRAAEDRRQRERERILQEKREAMERERRLNEKEQKIKEQRRIQAQMEVEAHKQHKLKWEHQKKEREEEEMRARHFRSDSEEKSAEAAALVSQRVANPREFFRQLSSTSVHTASSPISPFLVGSPCRQLHRSQTDSIFSFKESPSYTPASPYRSSLVSLQSISTSQSPTLFTNTAASSLQNGATVSIHRSSSKIMEPFAVTAAGPTPGLQTQSPLTNASATETESLIGNILDSLVFYPPPFAAEQLKTDESEMVDEFPPPPSGFENSSELAANQPETLVDPLDTLMPSLPPSCLLVPEPPARLLPALPVAPQMLKDLEPGTNSTARALVISTVEEEENEEREIKDEGKDVPGRDGERRGEEVGKGGQKEEEEHDGMIMEKHESEKESNGKMFEECENRKEQDGKMLEEHECGKEQDGKILEGCGSGREEDEKMLEGCGSGREQDEKMLEGCGSGREQDGKILEGCGSGKEQDEKMLEGCGSGREQDGKMLEGCGSGREQDEKMLKENESGKKQDGKRLEEHGSGKEQDGKMLEKHESGKEQDGKMLEEHECGKEQDGKMLEERGSGKEKDGKMLEEHECGKEQDGKMLEGCGSGREQDGKMLEGCGSGREQDEKMLKENESGKKQDGKRLEEHECGKEQDGKMLEEHESGKEKDGKMLEEHECRREQDGKMLEEHESGKEKDGKMLEERGNEKEKDGKMLEEHESGKEKDGKMLEERGSGKEQDGKMLEECESGKEKDGNIMEEEESEKIQDAKMMLECALEKEQDREITEKCEEDGKERKNEKMMEEHEQDGNIVDVIDDENEQDGGEITDELEVDKIQDGSIMVEQEIDKEQDWKIIEEFDSEKIQNAKIIVEHMREKEQDGHLAFDSEKEQDGKNMEVFETEQIQYVKRTEECGQDRKTVEKCEDVHVNEKEQDGKIVVKHEDGKSPEEHESEKKQDWKMIEDCESEKIQDGDIEEHESGKEEEIGKVFETEKMQNVEIMEERGQENEHNRKTVEKCEGEKVQDMKMMQSHDGEEEDGRRLEEQDWEIMEELQSENAKMMLEYKREREQECEIAERHEDRKSLEEHKSEKEQDWKMTEEESKKVQCGNIMEDHESEKGQDGMMENRQIQDNERMSRVYADRTVNVTMLRMDEAYTEIIKRDEATEEGVEQVESDNGNKKEEMNTLLIQAEESNAGTLFSQHSPPHFLESHATEPSQHNDASIPESISTPQDEPQMSSSHQINVPTIQVESDLSTQRDSEDMKEETSESVGSQASSKNSPDATSAEKGPNTETHVTVKDEQTEAEMLKEVTIVDRSNDLTEGIHAECKTSPISENQARIGQSDEREGLVPVSHFLQDQDTEMDLITHQLDSTNDISDVEEGESEAISLIVRDTDVEQKLKCDSDPHQENEDKCLQNHHGNTQ